MEISIIIVNWNAGSLLTDCLLSIAQFGGNHVAKVVVIDNGSTDGSVDAIERLGIPTLEIIRNRENAGFASACNQGAKLSTSEFILFLNPDARLNDSTLENALNAMFTPARSRVAIVGAQLVDPTGQIARSCARFPSATRFIAHAIGIDRLIPTIGYSMTEWNHAVSREVDHVIGAFFLIRREAFVEAGGFDERFFVYLEDLDLSRAVSRHGWRSWFESTSVAFHVGGGTSLKAKPQRLFYSLRSRLLYARKHFSALGYTAAAFATLCIEPGSRLLAACMRRDSAMAAETRDAYRWLWQWFLAGCRDNGARLPPR